MENSTMKKQGRKKNCKFLNMIYNCPSCVHKDNKDRRSRRKSGKLRRYPKRCLPKFCPLAKEEVKCEIIGCNRKANRMVGCCMMCLFHIRNPFYVEKAEFLEKAKRVRERK